MDVVETVAVRPRGNGEARFVRAIDLDQVDRIERVVAEIDGRPLDLSGRTSASRPERLRVTWPLAGEASSATASNPRALRLSYRVVGALASVGIRYELAWPAIPADRSYTIGATTIELALDDGITPTADPGIAGAGWAVDRRGLGITAARASLAPGDDATVVANLALGRPIAQSAWQFDADRARQLTPAFLSAGVCLLVVGAGVLLVLRMQYPRTPSQPRSAGAGEVARNLRRAGLVVIVFGLVCGVLADRLLWHYGWSPSAMAASIVVVGLVFVLAAPRFAER
jgi:hypothetical protein